MAALGKKAPALGPKDGERENFPEEENADPYRKHKEPHPSPGRMAQQGSPSAWAAFPQESSAFLIQTPQRSALGVRAPAAVAAPGSNVNGRVSEGLSSLLQAARSRSCQQGLVTWV